MCHLLFGSNACSQAEDKLPPCSSFAQAEKFHRSATMIQGEAAAGRTAFISAFAAPEVQKPPSSDRRARTTAEPGANVAASPVAGGSPAPMKPSLRVSDGLPSLSRQSSSAAAAVGRPSRPSRNIVFIGAEEELPEREPSRREFDDAAGSEEEEEEDVVIPDSVKQALKSSTSSKHSELMAAAAEEVMQQFDRELEPNWGLTMLVGVGETWLPSMLRQDAEGAVTDIPVLKLFEVRCGCRGFGACWLPSMLRQDECRGCRQ